MTTFKRSGPGAAATEARHGLVLRAIDALLARPQQAAKRGYTVEKLQLLRWRALNPLEASFCDDYAAESPRVIALGYVMRHRPDPWPAGEAAERFGDECGATVADDLMLARLQSADVEEARWRKAVANARKNRRTFRQWDDVTKCWIRTYCPECNGTGYTVGKYATDWTARDEGQRHTLRKPCERCRDVRPGRTARGSIRDPQLAFNRLVFEAGRLGYSPDGALWAPFPKGNLSSGERARRQALVSVLTELVGAGFTQPALEVATRLPHSTMSRLLSRAKMPNGQNGALNSGGGNSSHLGAVAFSRSHGAHSSSPVSLRTNTNDGGTNRE